MGELHHRVTRAAASVLGAKLDRIVIRAFAGELRDPAELAGPVLSVSGEARLEFGERALFVSWASGHGWPARFSITVQPCSAFADDAGLLEHDLGDVEPWRRCVGQHLRGVSVFGHGDTPHVVEWAFDDAVCWMADGDEDRVGDGDDLLVGSGRFPVDSHTRLLWSVHDGRAAPDRGP